MTDQNSFHVGQGTQQNHFAGIEQAMRAHTARLGSLDQMLDQMVEKAGTTPELKKQQEPSGRVCSWANESDTEGIIAGRNCRSIFGNNAGAHAALKKTPGQIAYERPRPGDDAALDCRPGDRATGTCPKDMAAQEKQRIQAYLELVL